MDKEKFQEYLTNRYEDQINWYEAKAARYKMLYLIFQWKVVILSPIVPVLVLYLPENYKWITAVISALLAIGTSALKTFKFQETWINYRTVAETLKKEKYYYEAGLDDYANAEDKEATFVERVEAVISREHSLWVTIHKPKEKHPVNNSTLEPRG